MNHTNIILGSWRRLGSLIHKEQPPSIILNGQGLTISDVIAVARYTARTDIDPSTIAKMDNCLTLLEERLHDGDVIYGVNTGFGGSADSRTKEVVELQQTLIRELHYGILPAGSRDHQSAPLGETLDRHRHDLSFDIGEELYFMPRSWTRAAILIRINSLISGVSAVRPVIVERMQDLLRYDIVPMIPLRGSISASGDLSPLSYISGVIQGKSTIRMLSRDHQHTYADTALANAGLEPVVLQAKEGLAMTNGTAISAGAAAVALHDANGLAVLAQVLTAMSVETLNGTAESFHPFFSQTRPHPGQTEAAQNILAFLEGSKLTKVNNGADFSLRQDRYSIRTAPQWIGPVLEDLVLAFQQLSIECNSATDNPLITPEGDSLHGGNFQAKAVTSATEKVRQGIQSIGRMLFAQCTEIINPATNRGLPPNLVAEDPSSSFIFKGTDLNIAALTAELGFLDHPVNHVQTAEMGNQSLNSLALISARYTHIAIEVLSQLVATHLMAACQALDLRAMHMQFLEQYRPQFKELVTQHWMIDGEHSHVLSHDSETTVQPSLANPVNHTENSSNLAADWSKTHPRSSCTTAFDKVFEPLWSQLLLSFDKTAAMDAQDRFIEIAKSLHSVLLDYGNPKTSFEFVSRLRDFTEALSVSLKATWCAHRDAYVVHGDASAVLGKASRAIYIFLRHTLKVPMLTKKKLLTPSLPEAGVGLAASELRAPTVGSFTSVVHRAIRDGTLVKVAVDVLDSCTGKPLE